MHTSIGRRYKQVLLDAILCVPLLMSCAVSARADLPVGSPVDSIPELSTLVIGNELSLQSPVLKEWFVRGALLSWYTGLARLDDIVFLTHLAIENNRVVNMAAVRPYVSKTQFARLKTLAKAKFGPVGFEVEEERCEGIHFSTHQAVAFGTKLGVAGVWGTAMEGGLAMVIFAGQPQMFLPWNSFSELEKRMSATAHKLATGSTQAIDTVIRTLKEDAKRAVPEERVACPPPDVTEVEGVSFSHSREDLTRLLGTPHTDNTLGTTKWPFSFEFGEQAAIHLKYTEVLSSEKILVLIAELKTAGDWQRGLDYLDKLKAKYGQPERIYHVEQYESPDSPNTKMPGSKSQRGTQYRYTWQTKDRRHFEVLVTRATGENPTFVEVLKGLDSTRRLPRLEDTPPRKATPSKEEDMRDKRWRSPITPAPATIGKD